MSRLTIMLDDNLESKLRGLQAKRIKDTGHSFSFSSCVNEVLRKGLK